MRGVLLGLAGFGAVLGPGPAASIQAQTICGSWQVPPPLNGHVKAIVQFQGETYLGGSFFGGNGNYVTRWNGTSYVPLPQQFQQGQVTSFAVYDDGTGPALYAGGSSFSLPTLPFPTTHYGVIRWNGQTWSGTGFPSSPGDVTDLVVYDDGQGPALYAATPTTSANLWRRSGGGWIQVPGAPSARTLAVFDDGAGPALYVGGRFTVAGGVPARSIARLRQGAWSEVGGGLYFSSGPLSSVGCLEVLDLGQGPRLFAGGAFNRAGTLPVQFVASWDGAAWTGYRFTGYIQFLISGDVITSLAALRNTQPPLLLAGASLLSTYPGGEIRGGLLAWDGERWFTAGAPATQEVRALLASDTPGSPSVLAGGWMPGPIPLAQWTPAPQCYPNCDCSSGPPVLNVADFTCFLQRFAAGDMWANCDVSTTSPVLNVADFTCYLQRYAAGCP